MTRHRRALAPLALLAFAALGAAPAAALELKETPSLAAEVAAGKLPPVAQRVPETPSIVTFDDPWQQPGEPGGTMRIIMARAKDTRLMVVYGYARLVAYNDKLKIVPDILESYDVQDGRVFTFHLRKGHKWSDGRPFTTEDFRYYWEDVANNKQLSPLGPPKILFVDGEPPKVEMLDATTVRYSWSKPNPFFLPELAGAAPLYIYRPAHYLKQFHEKYADPKKLKEEAKALGQRNWAALHNRMDSMYKNENPDMPSLEPWVNTSQQTDQRLIFKRNPYFYRVAANGYQLPYVDQVVMTLADSKIIPVKTGAGESDLQARYLRFDNYTFLKRAGKEKGFNVHLWRIAKGSHIALFPNLNVDDPAWRKVVRDVRFRRALSLGINRHEVNQVLYFGLAVEQADSVLPESPLYKPEYAKKWAEFDLNRANALLDEMGLKRGGDGRRLLSDGRPMEILIEAPAEGTEFTDVIRLIHDSWQKLGIKVIPKSYQREVMRQRIFAGETLMSMWSGLENGIATADSSPADLAPTSQIQLQWPKWGQYIETGGKAGEPIDMAPAKELEALTEAWRRAPTEEDRTHIWHEMLHIYTDQVFTIGIVAGVLQPVVVNEHMHNVPAKGIYNWDPGAQFGIYRPDQFWFDQPGKTAERDGERRAANETRN
ncbi:MAG TPA: ABC transporter substrate-binding protein [Alphaproteobacteria bacterium]|nr:ABC transporter substrate-binding protein [Alphaproteobacteria bacterium]